MSHGRLPSGLAFSLVVVGACGPTRALPVAPPLAHAATTEVGDADVSVVELTAAKAPVPLPLAEGQAKSSMSTARPTACPKGMILVEGEYCPNVEQTCLEWMEPPGDPYEHFRCKKYKAPAVCKGPRVHERFCIDETERTEEGSSLPRNHMSWTTATKLCETEGARLCKTSEWQFACEGEEMRPYPYGWERNSLACNVDVMTGLGKVGRLVDHRTPASAHPECVSPFGVHDMAGNVDEWATVDGAPRGKREVMKGSWWLPGRHACRSFQGGHGPLYGGTETGARCCKGAD